MLPWLSLHRFGPEPRSGTPLVLALHGLTGHGGRWRHLAETELTGTAVVAPDLPGHGDSDWDPPWGVDDAAAAIAGVLDELPEPSRLVVVGHSYGGAIALALAQRRRPDGLVLLDPAQGLDPAWARQVATESLASWDYPDAEAAKAAKRAEGWAEVPDDLLDEEIAAHLVPTPTGRVAWRVSAPAAATAWSEMARPFRLPPAGVPTRVVVAGRVAPPFVTADFLAACADRRPGAVAVHTVDTEHMVPFLAPELTGALVRELL